MRRYHNLSFLNCLRLTHTTVYTNTNMNITGEKQIDAVAIESQIWWQNNKDTSRAMKTPAKTTDGPRHQIMAMEPAWNTEDGGGRKKSAKDSFQGEIEEHGDDFYN